ncbi:MAG TPA: LLM class flavin-dependent oxidoreductase [Caulobacteraceae bacterium]|nr:LLM class flavin-dependent oxidoreductase [Caulobacteraceae bacterium]
MKVGVSLFAQNYVDWDRFEAAEAKVEAGSLPQLVPDAQIYREQFRLGRLVEPLGFDSLWTVEHHFTPYTMINNPTQFLAYFAGCTNRIDMGTMVVVLPWHDPVQVAEGFVALDHMLDGRRLKVGMGRGLGIREYNGLRVPMDESRERFKESLDVLRAALTDEWFSFEGQFHNIGRTSLRPRPRPNNTLLDDLYIAWGSPSSMPVAAHENCKPLFIPQRLWEEHKRELGEYNRIRVEEHGWKPERPTVVCWVYCAETDAEAEEGARQYLPEYGDSALRHYQFLGEHLQGLKGYEYYAQMAKMRANLPPEFDTAGIYLQNNIWGSPKTCLEKLERINSMMGADEFVAVFSYGSMSVEKAEANMRLFAEKVLPGTKAFAPAEVPLLVT